MFSRNLASPLSQNRSKYNIRTIVEHKKEYLAKLEKEELMKDHLMKKMSMKMMSGIPLVGGLNTSGAPHRRDAIISRQKSSRADEMSFFSGSHHGSTSPGKAK
jgi:hypothetical protein